MQFTEKETSEPTPEVENDAGHETKKKSKELKEKRKSSREEKEKIKVHSWITCFV